ncbi:O-6-alkylguanine-DNA alkyltransferase [Haematobia irritans]|uniref:O-6-alkylguanine-DNA alkyltransferase n=1 Tax=Haematobia irritans TaxID=7368 RepID=UPI003F4F5DFA
MFKNVVINTEISNKPLKLDYGFIETKFGQMVMANAVDNGILRIAYLHFADGKRIEDFAADMKKRWPNAEIREDMEKTQRSFETYFQKQKPKREVCLVLTGSKFQNKVWTTLLKIPYGEERTYQEVAAMIKRPKSVRAVATAVGKNDIAVFIPCHRVKSKNNDMHKYRWGNELKVKVLQDEKAKSLGDVSK